MKLLKLIKMDLRNLFRNPAWFIMNSLFPLVLALLLSYLAKPYYNESFSAINYYALTIIIFTACNSAVMASNTFLEERIKKANLRVSFAPVSKFSITLSKIIATALYVIFWLFIIGFIFAVFLKVPLNNHIVWIVLICLSFTASTLGILVSVIFKSEEVSNMIMSNLISLMAILGGSFFQIPKFLNKVSNLSFIKWVNESVFSIIYDFDYSSVSFTLSLLLMISIVSIILINVLFKEEDYL